MIDQLKKKLGEEAEKLQHELNVVLPQEIRKAVELGDLRENSEYKAALERQQFVQARLGQLRQRLSKLSQIDVSQIPADKVGLGSHVVVQDEKTGERETYSLVFGCKSRAPRSSRPERRRASREDRGARDLQPKTRL